MSPRARLIKAALLAVTVVGGAALSSGCAESRSEHQPTYTPQPQFIGIDELETIGDFLERVRALPPIYREGVFFMVRHEVEQNYTMVLEGNMKPTTSPKAKTDVMKLGAVQAATLKMVADAAGMQDVAKLYEERSQMYQAFVRGELEQATFVSRWTHNDKQVLAVMKKFVDGDSKKIEDTEGLSAFAKRFGSAIIANTKAYAWDIDTSSLR